MKKKRKRIFLMAAIVILTGGIILLLGDFSTGEGTVLNTQEMFQMWGGCGPASCKTLYEECADLANYLFCLGKDENDECGPACVEFGVPWQGCQGPLLPPNWKCKSWSTNCGEGEDGVCMLYGGQTCRPLPFSNKYPSCGYSPNCRNKAL